MYDEPGSLDDLDTIDEDDFRLDGIDDQYDEGGSGAAAAADPETDTDDDLKDWPDEEDTGSTTADQAVHIEGVPRSDSRMEAKWVEKRPRPLAVPWKCPVQQTPDHSRFFPPSLLLTLFTGKTTLVMLAAPLLFVRP